MTTTAHPVEIALAAIARSKPRNTTNAAASKPVPAVKPSRSPARRTPAKTTAATPQVNAKQMHAAVDAMPHSMNQQDREARTAAAAQFLAELFTGEDSSNCDWMSDALCAQVDPEAFFPGKGDGGKEAKKICQRCPVRTDCLMYGAVFGAEYGIWGGANTNTIKKIRKQLPEDQRRNWTDGLDSLPKNYHRSLR
jgi:WhiB family redox-sensing transcriptional regulator